MGELVKACVAVFVLCIIIIFIAIPAVELIEWWADIVEAYFKELRA